jgi:hypothetical protein
MTTNQLGIRNSNIIVPYTAATKQTKWLDISSAVSTSNTWTAHKSALARFTADSNGIWWMEARISADTGTGGTKRASQAFTISGVTFADLTASSTKQSATANKYEAGVTDLSSGTSVYILSNSSSFTVISSATDFNGVDTYISCQLKQEPTWASFGTTAAAALEGVLPVSVYIPPASAGIAGLVNNVAGNTAGTPILGKTDGVAVASGYVGEIISADGTPAGATTGQWMDGGCAGASLGSGIWDIQALHQSSGQANTNITIASIAIGTVTGNDGTGIVATNRTALPMAFTYGSNQLNISSPMYRVVVPAGSTVTYYPKFNASFSGGGVLNATNYIRARRLA